MKRSDIVHLDKAHVWHPYTAMAPYIKSGDPLVIARAEGVWLEDVDGTRYIDGNSSWWTSTLGHAHPRILRAAQEQLQTLAHCALAGITHAPAAQLASELCAIAPAGLTRAFFTDNGSTSVEVAIKMAVQMWGYLGQPKKTRFVALDGAFHGETIGATSLGGVEIFRRPFAGVLFECAHVPLPAEDNFGRAFDAIATLLKDGADSIAAVVVEPIVQGAAGMRFYSTAYLRELRTLCDKHDVLLIADEVFTGYGRTGPMWGCNHADIRPDLMCLGKAFASIIPMGATLATDRVFDAFRNRDDGALYYGHTYCGNPLGAAIAREVLAIYRDEDVLGQVSAKAPVIARAMSHFRSLPGVVSTRSLGMIGVAELGNPLEEHNTGYLSQLGWQLFAEARQRGAYLRPLGNTVYVCPPLTISESELELLLSIFEESILAIAKR